MSHTLLKTFVIIVMIACHSFEIQGQKSNSNNAVPIKLTRIPDRSTSDRKKMPSIDYIYCWYNGSEIYFDFKVPLGMCMLEVKDVQSDFEVQYTFDSSELFVLPVEDFKNLSVIVTTEIGAIYSGEFSN